MLHSFELEKYLEDLVPKRDPVLQAMEEQALKETIPVVTPAVGSYLAMLVAVSRSQRILEIGTATGYSTVWLARAAALADGHVTTIDMNAGRREQALQYFREAGVQDRVTSLLGDVRKILPDLTGDYDLIFIDAAKGEYLEYLELGLPKLSENGLLVADNVLFRGWVAPGAVYAPKYENMVSHLRCFLHKLCHHPELDTVILPLGDGLAVSRHKALSYPTGNESANKSLFK